ncbi:hypothetical protein HQN89_27485 [Paenibacillus frigoriresistens]|uniref:hypothetical protein n=1 Tax=Paenibacillus alginolyticus TaxID=59839 RepID=UPI0015665939|nr:hypothetical protein [Paenibacillus frigoriresistens]NRF94646.1 hypothetical protein [Paenibacillus frigoriresistens]
MFSRSYPEHLVQPFVVEDNGAKRANVGFIAYTSIGRPAEPVSGVLRGMVSELQSGK